MTMMTAALNRQEKTGCSVVANAQGDDVRGLMPAVGGLAGPEHARKAMLIQYLRELIRDLDTGRMIALDFTHDFEKITISVEWTGKGRT